MTPQQKQSFFQIAAWVANLMMPFVLVAGGWAITEIINNKTNIATINGTTQTREHAEEGRHELGKELNEIRASMWSIEKKIPDMVPPQWLRDDITEMKAEIQEIKVDIKSIKK